MVVSHHVGTLGANGNMEPSTKTRTLVRLTISLWLCRHDPSN